VCALVLRRRDDRPVPVDQGRRIAELIPDAQFVELPGADHVPFIGDADAVLAEIEGFLHLIRFEGEEVKRVGHGIVAVPDGPGRAIRCALSITEAAAASATMRASACIPRRGSTLSFDG